MNVADKEIAGTADVTVLQTLCTNTGSGLSSWWTVIL